MTDKKDFTLKPGERIYADSVDLVKEVEFKICFNGNVRFEYVTDPVALSIRVLEALKEIEEEGLGIITMYRDDFHRTELVEKKDDKK